MKSGYKRIGNYIRLVDERNRDLKVTTLLGLSIEKVFIASVANIIGSDMANYKIIRKGQFACSLMQVRRDKKIPVALLRDFDEAIISQAYPVFEIIDRNELDPEYVMMWMSRPEFDRHACFLAVGGVRGSLEWEDFCDMKLPVPSIEKQRKIVREYNTIVNRIHLNGQMNQKLEETAQAIYKHWFVDFEFPISAEYASSIGKPELEGKPYKSSGGEMVFCTHIEMEIPIFWQSELLCNITTMKYGKMLDSSLFLESGYPVYSGYGIRGYHTEYMYIEPQVLVLCRGVSGTGKVRMSPPYAHITNLSIVVESNEAKLNKQFLYFHLKNRNLRALDSGSAASQITIGDLEKYRILYPSKEYQDIFGILTKDIANKTLTHDLQIKRLEDLKEVLLAKISVAPKEEILAA